MLCFLLSLHIHIQINSFYCVQISFSWVKGYMPQCQRDHVLSLPGMAVAVLMEWGCLAEDQGLPLIQQTHKLSDRRTCLLPECIQFDLGWFRLAQFHLKDAIPIKSLHLNRQVKMILYLCPCILGIWCNARNLRLKYGFHRGHPHTGNGFILDSGYFMLLIICLPDASNICWQDICFIRFPSQFCGINNK